MSILKNNKIESENKKNHQNTINFYNMQKKSVNLEFCKKYWKLDFMNNFWIYELGDKK